MVSSNVVESLVWKYEVQLEVAAVGFQFLGTRSPLESPPLLLIAGGPKLYQGFSCVIWGVDYLSPH